MLAEEEAAVLDAAQGMLQLAMAESGGAHHERAIGDGIGQGRVLDGIAEQGGGSDGRAGFTEGDLIRIDERQICKAKIAHGAGGGADVQRVAGRNENDAKKTQRSSSITISRADCGGRVMDSGSVASGASTMPS